MHNYPQDWKYGIILTTDVDKVDFSQVFPKESSQVRYSLDGTQFVIKWDEHEEPTFITDGTVTPASILSHSECLTLMSTPEWSEPDPIVE